MQPDPAQPMSAIAALATTVAKLAVRCIAASCVTTSVAFFGAGPVLAAPTAPALVDEPCDIDVAEPAIAARLRCARLHVWRDPARPEQGRFELAVVVRRSAAPKPGAAPVLHLHGGPGGASTAWLGRGSRDPAAGHDLVAFDMRGGGRSTPRVCDGNSARLMREFMAPDGPAAAAARRTTVARDCLQAWRAAGFAPTHFGTDRNVADAEALRVALGVERWLLHGESYGTTVAAHYLATHPERIAAAVLDSLYPPDELVQPVSRMQAQLADRIGADCAHDAACAARFPGFGASALDAAVHDLDAKPLAVGRGASAVQLDGMALRQLVIGLAGDEAGARAIPLLVDATRRRDPRLLEGLVRAFDRTAEGGVNLAALLATDCRDRARHHVATGDDHAMQLLTGLPPRTCADWTEPADPPRWPWNTQIPTLLLAGGYDVFQPDTRAIAARIGAAAQVVEVPVAAHVVRGSGACVRGLISAWLAAPGQPPAENCIAAMPSPPFLRDAMPLPGVAQLIASAAPPPLALAALGSAVLALLTGLLVPLVQRLRRTAHPARRAPRAAAVAAALLMVAIVVPAGALAAGPDAAAAVLRFGLPAPWGLAAWLLWPAAAIALVAAAWSIVDRHALAATAALAVLVAVGCCAALALLPLP